MQVLLNMLVFANYRYIFMDEKYILTKNENGLYFWRSASSIKIKINIQPPPEIGFWVKPLASSWWDVSETPPEVVLWKDLFPDAQTMLT